MEKAPHGRTWSRKMSGLTRRSPDMVQQMLGVCEAKNGTKANKLLHARTDGYQRIWQNGEKNPNCEEVGFVSWVQAKYAVLLLPSRLWKKCRRDCRRFKMNEEKRKLDGMERHDRRAACNKRMVEMELVRQLSTAGVTTVRLRWVACNSWPVKFELLL